MCVHTYVCMCLSMFVSAYACMCVCIYLCMCAYVCMNVCIYVCVYVIHLSFGLTTGPKPLPKPALHIM
jgi:hypothetical protein